MRLTKLKAAVPHTVQQLTVVFIYLNPCIDQQDLHL